MTSVQKDLLMHLLQQGAWAEAVAFYQEETGADAATAGDAVRRMAARAGLRRMRWGFLPISLIAIAVCCAAVVWF